MNRREIIDSLDHLAQPEYLCIGGAALALAFFLILLVRRQPKHITAYSTANGKVMVGRSAIIELVQTSCEQIDEVTKPQVSIRVKGGKTQFTVRLKLASGAHLRTIEDTLQSHLRKALKENLGIENLGRIDIVATGFKSGRIDRSNSLTKKEPTSEATATAEAIAEDETLASDPEQTRTV
ncbi:MAG: alkaline shock response membrane anchor protein AmaP [Opitutales bacterium]